MGAKNTWIHLYPGKKPYLTIFSKILICMSDGIITPFYTISNIRLEHEEGGYVTIWFDLGGTVFTEPEAMTNMFVEHSTLMEFLEKEHPAHFHALAAATEAKTDRLNAANVDWESPLRVYIDRNIDLNVVQKERLEWFYARRARAADPDIQQELEDDWEHLTQQAEPLPHPTWDDVAHALIDSLNATAVELYPEVLDYDADGNSRLKDIIESHGERLANQLVALTRSVRQEEEKSAK